MRAVGFPSAPVSWLQSTATGTLWCERRSGPEDDDGYLGFLYGALTLSLKVEHGDTSELKEDSFRPGCIRPLAVLQLDL